MNLDQQCADAMRRIQKHINATAGQHKRAVLNSFDRYRFEQKREKMEMPFFIRADRENNRVILKVGPINPMHLNDGVLHLRLSEHEAECLACELTSPF